MLPLVVRVEDVPSRRATTYTFDASPVHVGRSELNDLTLAQPFVSLWHAIFWFDDQKVQCADLGSTNGTLLGQNPLAKGVRTELKGDTELNIGTLRIRFSREAPQVGGGAAVQPRRQTLFGNRVGAEAGHTMAIPRSAIPEVGSSTAVTILHEGPHAFVGPGGAPPGATRPEGRPAMPPSAGTPVTHFTAAEKPRTGPSEAVLQLVSQIAAPYLDFRHAWRTLLERLRPGLATLPEAERAEAAMLLQARFPTLLQEEEYRNLTRGLTSTSTPEASQMQAPAVPAEKIRLTPSPVAAPVVVAQDAIAQLLSQFAQSYAPTSRQLHSPAEVEGFLDRLAVLMETFANAFLELRKGKEQFEKEVGVALGGARGPLQRARNVEEVLRYLLETGAEHARKPEELIRGFAEVMIHHVALLNGVRQGARGLLDQLGPDALARRGAASSGVVDLLLPTRALWRRFLARHTELREEEGQLTTALFGPEFARAYVSVASDNVEDSGRAGGGT